jgi:hypothetical protein
VCFVFIILFSPAKSGAFCFLSFLRTQLQKKFVLVKVDIYYPYYEAEAVWDELKYSLRSLKHLSFEHRVVIVGDLPEWINPETILHIPHERITTDDEGTCVLDATSKLLAYLQHPQAAPYFIRMYDDIFYLKPTTIQDMMTVRIMGDWKNVERTDETVWKRHLWKTLDALAQRELTQLNTETHLPELFGRDNMKEVFEQFNPKENGLLTSTLYYNYYKQFYAQTITLNKADGEKAGYYGYDNDYSYASPSSVNQVADLCNRKRFLNFNDNGFNIHIMNYLKQTFKEKSPYEK